MSTINGFGTKYYGQRDFESDGSHITTKWFVFAFIPVVPMGSARVRILDAVSIPFLISTPTELEIIEELPTNWVQALYIYLYVFCLLFAFTTADKKHWSGTTQFLLVLFFMVLPKLLRWFARTRAVN